MAKSPGSFPRGGGLRTHEGLIALKSERKDYTATFFLSFSFVCGCQSRQPQLASSGVKIFFTSMWSFLKSCVRRLHQETEKLASPQSTCSLEDTRGRVRGVPRPVIGSLRGNIARSRGPTSWNQQPVTDIILLHRRRREETNHILL